MIRVILVDDHPIVRRGLKETLAAEADLAVVAEAERSEEVLAALQQHPCDVVLLDLSLPGRGGLDVLKDVRRDFPGVRVLVVSTHDESQYAVRAMRAGAAGYLTKNSAPEELVRAVRSVVSTGRHITDDVASALAEYALDDRSGFLHERLSDREHEVLRRLTAGRTVSEIAGELSLSVKTVSTYRSRMVQKLGAKSTADLVRYAIEHQLFS
ncbi:MAG: response regulator transcription factor [Acidobacteriota bacterium]|nr:response regulator transcription factor [Acidobacteriota bacterium]